MDPGYHDSGFSIPSVFKTTNNGLASTVKSHSLLPPPDPTLWEHPVGPPLYEVCHNGYHAVVRRTNSDLGQYALNHKATGKTPGSEDSAYWLDRSASVCSESLSHQQGFENVTASRPRSISSYSAQDIRAYGKEILSERPASQSSQETPVHLVAQRSREELGYQSFFSYSSRFQGSHLFLQDTECPTTQSRQLQLRSQTPHTYQQILGASSSQMPRQAERSFNLQSLAPQDQRQHRPHREQNYRMTRLSSLRAAQSSQMPHKSQRRRASQACKSCRACRQKCVTTEGNNECDRCIKTRPNQKCEYSKKGEPNLDRELRKRPPTRSSSSGQFSTSGHASSEVLYRDVPDGDKSGIDNFSLTELFLRGCERFAALRSLLRALGESANHTTPEGLLADSSIDTMGRLLVLAGLSISAQFTPELASICGGDNQSGDYFLEKARQMESSQWGDKYIQRAQVFLFLAFAEWEKGKILESRCYLHRATSISLYLQIHYYAANRRPDRIDPWSLTQKDSVRRMFSKIQSEKKDREGNDFDRFFDIEGIRAIVFQALSR